jgi:hypothetical protein
LGYAFSERTGKGFLKESRMVANKGFVDNKGFLRRAFASDDGDEGLRLAAANQQSFIVGDRDSNKTHEKSTGFFIFVFACAGLGDSGVAEVVD